MPPMISLVGVAKLYPGQTTPAVTSLDLDIAEGEIVVLVGPSGCGKTTTLKMINRLVEPSAGTITVAGTDITATPCGRILPEPRGSRGSSLCTDGPPHPPQAALVPRRP